MVLSSFDYSCQQRARLQRDMPLRQDIQDIKEAWHLLKSVQPIFSQHLPSPEQFGGAPARPRVTPDDITRLRTDIQLLAHALQQVRVERELDSIKFCRVEQSFASLLELFESLVGNDIPRTAKGKLPYDLQLSISDPDLQFPKLAALCAYQLHIDNAAARRVNPWKLSLQVTDESTKSGHCLSDRDPTPPSSQRFVRFPETHESLAEVSRVLQDFFTTVREIFPDSPSQPGEDLYIYDFSYSEINDIKDAYDFSDICSSLFDRLSKSTCNVTHQARLCLSGFMEDQLEMFRDDCHKSFWQPAKCLRSDQPPPSVTDELCEHAQDAKRKKSTISVAFNEHGIWQNAHKSGCKIYPAKQDPHTLHDLLSPPAGVHHSPSAFEREDRETTGALLASSLFRLCTSPWIQESLQKESVLFLPRSEPTRRPVHRRPYITCTLDSRQPVIPTDEDLAAFGVLLMELKTGQTARWSDADCDYETSEPSNQVRLGRVLEDWRKEIGFRYEVVGRVCQAYESCLETFHHPDLDDSHKAHALIYKRIFKPIARALTDDFPSTRGHFESMPSLLAADFGSRRHQSAKNTRLVLYDDSSSTECEEAIRAEQFQKQQLESFVTRIPKPPTRRAKATKRIKIAILDSGVDPKDNMIAAATGKRIKECKGFVGDEDDFGDKSVSGHGTHVTRILLQVAHAAEFYIAKISDDISVEARDMGNISRALQWVVDEKQVDIISMSFGYEGHYPEVDVAIDWAWKQGKLMFAAASNGGGNKAMSRPARCPGVICVHACDGMGNSAKWGKNPNRKRGVDNFAVLGVSIKSRWKGSPVWKSGTSFATPLAAAYAANILQFAEVHCGTRLDSWQMQKLHTEAGMVEIFRLMAVERDGLFYVQPGELWEQRSDEQVAELIADRIRRL